MLFGGLYQFDQGINDSPWGVYTGALKMAIALEDFLVKKDDPNQVNNLAMTRIMKVAVVQRLTDFYGDVPLTDAGQAYISNNMKPKYDRQVDIYKYMLQTLDQAAQSFSTDATVVSLTWKGNADAKKARDIVYNAILISGKNMHIPDVKNRYESFISRCSPCKNLCRKSYCGRCHNKQL